MSDWGNEETATVDFSDERLNKRMRVLPDRLGSKPIASLPVACKGWDETIAAYRFFNNEKVTDQKVLSSHRDATRKRMEGHKVVLCVQDTTEMDFTGRKLKGAGCYKKLMEEVSGKPILGEVEFKIPKAEGRSSRRVVQSVKAGRVRLKPPYRKGEKLPEVEINVVFVEENNPPEGEEPITWLLLTSLPVDTFEQACLVVE